MTKLFDPTPFFLIRKNIVYVKLQPRMQGLVMSRLGWRLKYVLILHETGDQCQL